MIIIIDIEKLIIKGYLKNTRKQILSMFDINYHIFCVSIKVYENRDRTNQKLKDGKRKKKLNEEQINEIKTLIDKDCAFTLRCIKIKI